MKKTNVVAILGIVFAVVIVLVLGILALVKSSSKGRTTESMLLNIC